MAVQFLVHHESDNVGVAVDDLESGSVVTGRYRDQAGDLSITLTTAAPLGHKIAMKDISKGKEVIEYGVVIGLATTDISLGEIVHVHNMKGQRWN